MTNSYENNRELNVDMRQTDEWVRDLIMNGRKTNTCVTHRNNVKQCLRKLMMNSMPTRAEDATTETVMFLWSALTVKEEVKIGYLRSFANMVKFHTGREILRDARILRNREQFNRVFISANDFCILYKHADEMQKLILCLGAYMGLRRKEIAELKDEDIDGDIITIHGKGHGDGLISTMKIPAPVMTAIEDYRSSIFKKGLKTDNFLIQSRDHRGFLHGVTPAKIGNEVNILAKETKIRVTTHSLRRFFATTLYYETDCDLQTVRSLMRHADLSTTMKCYVDAYQKNERDASERLTEYITKMIESMNNGSEVSHEEAPVCMIIDQTN